MAEIERIKLESGRTLHCLTNGEGRVHGTFEVREDGRTRQWVEVWGGEYKLLGGTPVWPGPISIMRAMLRGEI